MSNFIIVKKINEKKFINKFVFHLRKINFIEKKLSNIIKIFKYLLLK